MKRCPNDLTIKEFSNYLPAWVKEQMLAKQGKEEESEYDEEYDEEEESEKSEKSSEEEGDQEEEEEKLTEEQIELQEKSKMIKQLKDIEEFGNPGEGFEWASDVDSEGNQIWGEEGEDWDFYYQEDKEAYHRGESTLPPLLNPN